MICVYPRFVEESPDFAPQALVRLSALKSYLSENNMEFHLEMLEEAIKKIKKQPGQ